MNFIKQCKATESYRIDLVESDIVYTSVKHDGVYLQIHKKDNDCKIYLSSGREVNIPSIAELIMDGIFDSEIVLECEFIVYNNRSMADNEVKSLSKGNKLVHTGVIYIFDIINNYTFNNRLVFENEHLGYRPNVGVLRGSEIEVVYYEKKTIFSQVETIAERCEYDNIEGLMLKYPTHIQTEGKKSKLAIKLKPLNTADLTIVEVLDNGYILLVDENGITAKVKMNSVSLELCRVGGIIEIAFDFIGKKYNQARFIDFRFDKVEV